MKRLYLLIGIYLCSLPVVLVAGDQQYYDLGNFKLENGQIIRECRLGYRTYGRLDAQKSNAILFPTWLGGVSRDIGHLLGAGKLLDTTNFFIIAVDAFGNGVSSSPSNSRLQPGRKFPQFNIRDLIRAQHHFLTEYFGLKQIFAIVGGSMGSFQGFELLVNYPEFAQKAVLYVASPQITSYDMLETKTQIQIIEDGWNCNQPEAEIARTIELLMHLFARTPSYRVKITTPADFPEYWDHLVTEPPAFIVADRYSQLQAILQHDIAAPFGGSLTQAAHQIKAQTLIIVNRQDQIVNCQPALDFAPLINAETLVLDSDCGHLVIGCEMDTVRRRIAGFLNK